MGRQSRPTGPFWPTPAKWKAWIEQVMADKGVTQADLHRETGASTAAISDLFNESKNVRQSRLVPAIHRALGLPEPLPPAPRKRDERERDELLRELLELWLDLAAPDRELLMSLARRARTRGAS